MAEDLLSRTSRQAVLSSGLAEYSEYTGTKFWKELRAQALERDGYRCRGCGATENLVVHHRRYPECLGTETVEDLTTLCEGPGSCHRAIHRAVQKRRETAAKAERQAALDSILEPSLEPTRVQA